MVFIIKKKKIKKIKIKKNEIKIIEIKIIEIVKGAMTLQLSRAIPNCI